MHRGIQLSMLALILVSASCSGGDKKVNPDDLFREWHWTAITEGEPQQVAQPERYRITPQKGDVFTLFAGCNGGRGRWTLEEPNAITLSHIITTKKGCPPGTRDTEFLRLLQAAESCTIEGNVLILKGAGIPGEMRFQAAAPETE